MSVGYNEITDPSLVCCLHVYLYLCIRLLDPLIVDKVIYRHPERLKYDIAGTSSRITSSPSASLNVPETTQ